ncbi:hypothetical protein J6Z48_02060 [bacterium]|nr:hypothetical protein [bacterium]
MEGYRQKEVRNVETERRPHNFTYFAEEITSITDQIEREKNVQELNYGECRNLRRELYKSDVPHAQEFLIEGAIGKLEKDITRNNVARSLGTNKLEGVITKAGKLDAIDWTERELFYAVHQERRNGTVGTQSREAKLVNCIIENDINKAREVLDVEWNRADHYYKAYNNMLDRDELDQMKLEFVVCTNARGLNGYKEVYKEHQNFIESHGLQEYYQETLPNSFIK